MQCDGNTQTKALEADEDELLVLAEKVLDRITRWVLKKPEAFGKLASLDDKALDAVLVHIGDPAPSRRRSGKTPR